MRTVPLMAFLVAVASPVLADTDLLSAYRIVLSNDATYLAARASAEADREEVPKAFAGFLPNISISGTISKNETDTATKNTGGVESTRTSRYQSENYSLNLRQPLYRKQIAAQYGQAEAIAQRADVSLEHERQALALRVSQAYLDALMADEQLDFARAKKKTFINMLDQAERAYKAGVGTLTDILEIRARRDLSLAQEMEAENEVQNTLQTLQMMMNSPPGKLRRIDAKKLPIRYPGGDADLNTWISRAEAASPTINALRRDIDSAKYELEKARSGHYPTLDLIASLKKASNESEVSLNLDTQTNLIGLQLNMPLFAGGYVSASVRQAHARLEQASQKLEAARREVLLGVRREFGNVAMNAAKVSALEEALASAEDALIGTQKGVLAGTRTTIDVLNAQNQSIQTSVDLAKARNLFVFSYLKLRDGAGGLDDEVMQTANRWLTSNSVATVNNIAYVPPRPMESLRDDQWARIEALCSGYVNPNGVGGRTNRQFVEAVLWVARTGSGWQELPKHFGTWQSTYLRFNNWGKKGVWERLARGLKGDAELERLFGKTSIFGNQYAEEIESGRKTGAALTRSEQIALLPVPVSKPTALAHK